MFADENRTIGAGRNSVLLRYRARGDPRAVPAALKSLRHAHRRRRHTATTTPPPTHKPPRRRRRIRTHIVHVVARAHTQSAVVVVVAVAAARAVASRDRSGQTPPAAVRVVPRLSSSRSVVPPRATLVLCAGMVVLGRRSSSDPAAVALGELDKLDHSGGIGLFSALGPAMDLSTAAYRYNQNMMEYYTCEHCTTFVTRFIRTVASPFLGGHYAFAPLVRGGLF